MKKVVSAGIALALAMGLLLIQAMPVSACEYEGCSPGFWKNHTGAWEGYCPEVTLEEVFDIPDEYGLDNCTLLDALKFQGGPGEVGMAQSLLRQTVASLLNASSSCIDFPVDACRVVEYTNRALASGDRCTMEALKDRADTDNNLGCDCNCTAVPDKKKK